MDVRNCKSCGKMFNYIGGPPLCVSCLRKLDEKFKEVKEYIYQNPGAGIQEVSEAMEVSTGQIRNWIREERLSFSEDSPIGIDCEMCGVTIKTGKFCASCKDKMINHLGNAYKKEENPESKKAGKTNPKMRFLDS